MAKKKSFNIENIPDAGQLFMRVHKNFCIDGQSILPGVFRDHEGTMSTDWSKYSIAEQTKSRGRIPEDNGVIVLSSVGDIRKKQPLMVNHSPIYPSNRAHTDVVGDKDEEVRIHLKRHSQWVVRPPSIP